MPNPRRVRRLGDGLLEQIVDRPERTLRRRRARLQARQIEHVLDQPAQPRDLDSDRLEQPGAIVARQVELRALEPVDRGAHRRERRAEVVRDGVEDDRLDRVRAAEPSRPLAARRRHLAAPGLQPRTASARSGPLRRARSRRAHGSRRAAPPAAARQRHRRAALPLARAAQPRQRAGVRAWRAHSPRPR